MLCLERIPPAGRQDGLGLSGAGFGGAVTRTAARGCLYGWNGRPEGNGVTGLGEETSLGGPSDCMSVDWGNGPYDCRCRPRSDVLG